MCVCVCASLHMLVMSILECVQKVCVCYMYIPGAYYELRSATQAGTTACVYVHIVHVRSATQAGTSACVYVHNQ